MEIRAGDGGVGTAAMGDRERAPGGRRSAAIGCALLLGAALAARAAPDRVPALEAGAVAHSVLVIQAGHQGDAWSDGLMRGIAEGFDLAPERPELWVEYMDVERLRHPRHFRQLAALYREKFRQASFDAAIVCGERAVRFVLERRQALLGDLPLVLCGSDGAVLGERPPRATAVIGRDDFRGTLDVAFRLQPGARRIVIIAPGLFNRHHVEPLVADYRPRVELEVWSDSSLAALEERVARLDPGTVVLPIASPISPEGTALPFEAFLRRLAARSAAPLYAVRASALGYGVIGGHMTSATAIGRASAELALRILRGEPAASIEPVRDGMSRYLFDARELRRYGLDAGRLPADSRLEYQPQSLYDRHPLAVWSAIAVLLALAGFIAVLLHHIGVRRRAEGEAREAQTRLLAQQRRENERVAGELERVREELVRKTRLAVTGELAASVAHDLRNPLAAVRNAHYLLRRRVGPGRPDWRRYLDVIGDELATAERRLGNLMALARVAEPHLERVDLGRSWRESLRRVDPRSRIRLELDLDPDPFTVWADPPQLTRVLDNLTCNAGEAGARWLRIRARREADWDVIELRDDGEGIASRIGERAFEPLISGRSGGTGLGLATCRQIVEQHGGRIELLGAVGSGAAFRLRLPRHARSPEPVAGARVVSHAG